MTRPRRATPPRGAHRAPPIYHLNAPRGTCRYCGKPCKSARARSHSTCASSYRALVDYREADIAAAEAAGHKPRCAYCGNDNLKELQDDHHVPLKDGGAQEWRVWLCKHNENCPGSHHKKTARENSRRAAAKRGTRMAAKTRGGRKPTPAPAAPPPPSGPPSDTPGQLPATPPLFPPWGRRYLAWGVLVSCALWIVAELVGNDGPRVAVLFLLVWVVPAAVLVFRRRVRHGRRVALVRARDIVALAMHQPADKVRARARGWVKEEDVWLPLPLEIGYSHLVQDGDEGMRSAVQQNISRAFDMDVVCTWSTRANLLLIEADDEYEEYEDADDDEDTGATEEHAEAPGEEPEPDPVEQQRRAIADGVAKVAASPVTVVVHTVGADPSGDPRIDALALSFLPVAAIHVPEKRDEVDVKIGSLLGGNWLGKWGQQSVFYERTEPLPEQVPLPTGVTSEVTEPIQGEVLNADGTPALPANEPEQVRVLIDANGNERIDTLPTTVAVPKVPVRFGTPDACPIGVGEGGRLAEWKYRKQPHVGLAGGTGTGKSSQLQVAPLWAHINRKRWYQAFLDGKGTKLAGMRAWPNVVAWGMKSVDGSHHLAAGILWLYNLMNTRYQQIQDGEAQDWQFPRLLVTVDELTSMFKFLEKDWKAGKPVFELDNEDEELLLYGKRTGNHPAIGMFMDLLRLARECGIHMWVANQQLNADILDGTESRENLGGRAMLGDAGPESSGMMFGDRKAGKLIPPGIPGRGLWQADGDPKPMLYQAYYAPVPGVRGDYLDDEGYPDKPGSMSGAEKWAMVAPLFGDMPPKVGWRCKRKPSELPTQDSAIWKALISPGGETLIIPRGYDDDADARADGMAQEERTERKKARRAIREISASDLRECPPPPGTAWTVLDDDAPEGEQHRVVDKVELHDSGDIEITWHIPGQDDPEAILWAPDTVFTLAEPVWLDDEEEG